jgi:Rhodanese-like domain
MKSGPSALRLFLLPFFFICALLPLHAQFAAPAQSVGASVIPNSALLQPDQLHRELQAHSPLLIFQVGSRVLFEEAHIPGAEFAGPGSTSEGLAILRARVQRLPRTQRIVIYCGCCPWDRCPNIGTAWQLLRSMGFTQVRALYLAQNFGADWVARGYHADSSH